MSKVKITWRVEDGYAGGDRPHHTLLSPEMLDMDCTDEQLADQIAEVVQEDFDMRISLGLATKDVEAAVKALRAAATVEG